MTMIRANSLESFLTSQVGTGSNAHCFAGAVLSTFATPSDVTGLKCDSGSDTERLVMRRAGASVVDARIRSTLFENCYANSSAKCSIIATFGG